MNLNNDVILAVLKLSRAMRRCPPDPGEHPFPPAAGRLLECIATNPNASPRDLSELLDLRPSSLSEMLARAESEGWILRTADEEDRRIQRISLSADGTSMVSRMQEAREKDAAKKTACFTDEEKAQFCALCNRLSDHMESLASDLPENLRRPPHGGPGPHGPHGPHGGPDAHDPRGPHGGPDAHGPRMPLPPEARIRC